MPINFNSEKFLFAKIDFDNSIGDLLIIDLSKKYLTYNIILKSSKIIYIYYLQQFYQFPVNQFEIELDCQTFNDFLNIFKN